MWGSVITHIIVNIIVSITIILVLQYMWEVIIDTYSKKKTKDLVNTQIDKYKRMMDSIASPSTEEPPAIEPAIIKDMGTDLLAFMQSQ